ncbi:MAG: hypothetical protein AABX03_04825 [Nanoarchaeota archaeon]
MESYRDIEYIVMPRKKKHEWPGRIDKGRIKRGPIIINPNEPETPVDKPNPNPYRSPYERGPGNDRINPGIPKKNPDPSYRYLNYN